MTALNRWRLGVVGVIADWLLPFGFFVFLGGIFLADGRSAYKTVVYIGTLAPTLALLVLAPERAWRALARRAGLAALLAFLAWMAASSLWARHPDGSNYFLYAFYVALMSFNIVLAAPGRDARLLAAFDVATAVAVVAGLAYLVRFYLVIGHPLGDRIAGYNGLSNPLYSGYLYGAFLTYLLVRLPAATRFGNGAALIAMVALTAFAWFTQSRTPVLALFLAVLAQVRYRGRSFRWLFAGLVAVYVLAFTLGYDRLLARGTSHRLELWGDSFRLWLDAFWFGHGVGNRIVIAVGRGWHFYDTHNIHLAVAYFGGVVGLALWLALLARSAVIAWRRADSEVGCLALALLVYGMAAAGFDGGHLIARPIEMWFLLWLPIGLCLRLESNGASQPHRPGGATRFCQAR